MKQRWVWITGSAIGLVLLVLLLTTEARYLSFIDSLDEVNTEVRWASSRLESDPATGRSVLNLTFEILFSNTSTLPMWVEAINTQLYFNDESIGSFTISEGNYEVLPQQTQAIPLIVPFFEARQEQFEAAKAQGLTMRLSGRARARFGAAQESLKTFYDVDGRFVLQEDAP